MSCERRGRIQEETAAVRDARSAALARMKQREWRANRVESERLVPGSSCGEEELFGLWSAGTRSGSCPRDPDGRHREDALDLAQEIFLKVFQALYRFNPAYKFSTWLFRIAGNAAIDHLRKRRPRTVPLEIPDPERRVSSVSGRAAFELAGSLRGAAEHGAGEGHSSGRSRSSSRNFAS